MVKIDSINDVKSLLHGNHESQQKIQVGYGGEIKDEPVRNVGDKWTDDDGNEWVQKDGYKMKLGKEWQQELHQYLHSFQNCPKETCLCTLPKSIDEKMKSIHGMCLDCVVEMEHKIRLEGKWEDYERNKIKQNAMAWLQEAERDKNLIAEELSRVDFVNSFGDVEKWNTGITKEDVLLKIEEEFEKFREDFLSKLEVINHENIGDGGGQSEIDA
jgi:hypothetical protein